MQFVTFADGDAETAFLTSLQNRKVIMSKFFNTSSATYVDASGILKINTKRGRTQYWFQKTTEMPGYRLNKIKHV